MSQRNGSGRQSLLFNANLIDLREQERRARSAAQAPVRDPLLVPLPQTASEKAFMARWMVQATLPYRRFEGTQYVRRNGDLTMTVTALSADGIPYGLYPRLLMQYLSTRAVQNRSREIYLGKTVSEFFRRLNVRLTGGANGTIGRVKGQANALFSSAISLRFGDKHQDTRKNMIIADEQTTWWSLERSGGNDDPWNAYVVLSSIFYQDLIDHAVPVNMEIIARVQSSVLALDLYLWLAWRMFTLREPTAITWEQLMFQFGTSTSSSRDGRKGFKRNLLTALKSVRDQWHGLNVSPGDGCLMLHPSPLSVKPRALIQVPA